MAALDSERVKSALISKLKCKQDESDHHRYILYDRDGKTILASTKISHGSKHDIGDTLLSLMARQMRLGTKANFVGMVQCTLSYEDCLTIIKSMSSQKS
jgi:hypothetical protein